jgi:hypothetical protein
VETRVNPNSVDVIVRNPTNVIASRAVARIVMADARRVVGATTPRLASDAGIVRLALPPIPATATRTYTVRLEARPAPPKARARPAPRPRPAPRKAPWWQFWKHL